MEMRSILNALAGGYVAPTSGGDAVPIRRRCLRAATLCSERQRPPSNRPGPAELPENTLAQYKENARRLIRAKSATPSGAVNSSRAKGATIAQVLYMLGVEPVRDAYGPRVRRAADSPSEQLGRPAWT